MYSTIPPFDYKEINWLEAGNAKRPNEVHLLNNAAAFMFRRLLMQDAMSVFKWNVPEHWDLTYTLYTLYGYGYFAVINTDKFGVIPQACGLSGRNVFYQPTEAIIANPLIRITKNPVIGKSCTIIRLQPDYCGIMDIVDTYAGLLAMTMQTLTTNLTNSRLAWVFAAQNQAMANSYKKMFDDIASGKPAVVVNKDLFNETTGGSNWDKFDTNIKQTFIAPELTEMTRKLRNMFATEIGIPNANIEKKERMIVDEVNANNIETYSKCARWLEQLQDGCRRTNDMFGTDISVNWRFKPQLMGGGENVPISDGTISV